MPFVVEVLDHLAHEDDQRRVQPFGLANGVLEPGLSAKRVERGQLARLVDGGDLLPNIWQEFIVLKQLQSRPDAQHLARVLSGKK